MCLAWSRDQAHLARRTRWSGGFLACELLPDVGLLQEMRGSSFSRAIELWSSTQTDQSPWAERVHATYVRRFRRAGSAGEFGEEGACCSRGPIACAVRFRACGRGIGAASGLDGRYDHSAQGAICRLPWSVHSAAFDVGIDSLVKQRVQTYLQNIGRGRGGAGLQLLLLACTGLSCVPAASWWRSQVSRTLSWELRSAVVRSLR